MKQFFLAAILFISTMTRSQELYVFSDPASNVPAKSISVKLSSYFLPKPNDANKFMHRYVPEVMFGLSKNFMLRANLSFSNMHTDRFIWESVYLYGKYRIFTRDELHRHFRMAAFADVSYSRNPFHYDEVSLMGDKSGVQAGIIATQLWNKLAISGTISHTQVLHKSRKYANNQVYSFPYQAFNYSLSAGYLILPVEYKDYRQTNLNFYLEFLAQQTLDPNKYYIDMAPAVQFIFNSNTKVNIGYRFQLGSNEMWRMATDTWHVGVERTFLN